MKYVVVTGGVVSGLGKGITASSIGRLLQESGLSCTAIKIDPYLNIDAGCMSPYEHGEVFVLNDGGEVDLDLGNYERFMQINLTRDHNITTGKIYQSVLTRERRGDYLGKTVQIIPHVTDAVQEWIARVSEIPVNGTSKSPDVCVIELGGTVGDIESSLFLEALRQFAYRVGRDNFCHLHVSLVAVVGAVGEQKSKPTQHSVRCLGAVGLTPDLIICRSGKPLERSIREKISMFSMVPPTHVISVHDVENIYKVPGLLLSQNVPSLVMNCLRINKMPPNNVILWDTLAEKKSTITKEVTIGIVGKYTGLTDSYISLLKALETGSMHADRKLVVNWIESSKLENETKDKDREAYDQAWANLRAVDGILIPGGFGDRGIEGKVLAAHYARTQKVPYLGICLGMQIMVIEYARNVLGLKRANSAEFDKETQHKVVIFMPEISQTEMGGNMRLGNRVCNVRKDSLAHLLYGSSEIFERHRHRYEVNEQYVSDLEEQGLLFTGKDSLGVRMEITELSKEKHPFYWGCQFHPEFKSRPLKPSPPFVGLVRAATGQLDREYLPGSPKINPVEASKHGLEIKDDKIQFAAVSPSNAKAGQKQSRIGK